MNKTTKKRCKQEAIHAPPEHCTQGALHAMDTTRRERCASSEHCTYEALHAMSIATREYCEQRTLQARNTARKFNTEAKGTARGGGTARTEH